MAKANRVHSTPRQTAPKIQPQKSVSLPAIDPTMLPEVAKEAAANWSVHKDPAGVPHSPIIPCFQLDPS
jgi:hypothetical protein